MARRELVIHLTTSEPRVSLWCDRCFTGARYEVDLLRLSESGVTVLRKIDRCVRCDHHA